MAKNCRGIIRRIFRGKLNSVHVIVEKKNENSWPILNSKVGIE